MKKNASNTAEKYIAVLSDLNTKILEQASTL